MRRNDHFARKQIALLIWFSMLCVTLSCTSEERRAGPLLHPTRGTILISIDTLRADHLQAYGYDRDTSPFLSSLAARGALFESAITPIPSTLPAHASMLTGLHPREHLVFPPDSVIPDSIQTVAEYFQQAGYVTAGFTDGGFMSGSFGFERGFDEWNDDPRREGVPDSRRLDVILQNGLDFLRSLAPEERFFLFLHTYAVHDPYAPPAEYADRYWPHPRPDQLWSPTGPNFIRFNCGHESLSATDLDYFVALYDAGIRYTDDSLALFFSELPAAGVNPDEMTIVITSDHGEEFLEHDLLSHAQVYHHNLHVPFIFLHPEIETQRISKQVSIADITPTLLESAGIAPPISRSSRSLIDVMTGRAETQSDSERIIYAQASTGGADSAYQQRDGQPETYQLVESPFLGRWITPRGHEFDVLGDSFSFDARSYLTPRRMRIEIDGTLSKEIMIDRLNSRAKTDPPQTVRIALPPDGQRHTVRISADDCSPVEDPNSPDCRCLSFNVQGLPQRRIGLFEVQADPLGQRDLSDKRKGLAREIASKKKNEQNSYRAAAEAKSHELPPDTIKRLEALGYL